MKKNHILFWVLGCFLSQLAIAQQPQHPSPLFPEGVRSFKGYDLSQRLNSQAIGTPPKPTLRWQDSAAITTTALDNTYDFFGHLGASMHVARASCHDPQGNVYLTGSSGNTANKSGEITTHKISSDGTLLWSVSLPAASYTVNSGTAITRTSDGFIYMVGYQWNQTSMDLLCVKMNSEGQILWQRLLGTPNSFQIPKAITVSDSGNLYVAGITFLSSKITYYVTKLAVDGSLAWEFSDSSFPSQTWNEPKAIVLDSQENVIVNGYGFEGSSNFTKLVTLKLNSSGTLQWKKYKTNQFVVDGEMVEDDIWAKDMTIDEQDNVYTLSNLSGAIGTESLTIKYDADGNELWNVAHQSGNDFTIMEKMELSQGKLFVGGFHHGIEDDGLMAAGITTDGVIDWSETSNETLVFGSNFNMQLLGTTLFLDMVFVDLDTSESTLISKSFAVSDGATVEESDYYLNNVQMGFTVGDFGKVIHSETEKIIAFSPFYSTLGQLIEVKKIDQNATVLWNYRHQSINSLKSNVYATVSDAASNVYTVTGLFYIDPSDLNTLREKSSVTKYNPGGTIESSLLLSDVSGVSNIRVAIDAQDNLVFLMRTDQSNTVTLKKISSGFTVLWTLNFDLESFNPDSLWIDHENNIYIVSSSTSLTNPDKIDVAVRKYNSSGTLVYNNHFQSAENSIIKTYPLKVQTNSDGELLIAGVVSEGLIVGSDEVYYPFVLKVSPEGVQDYFKFFPISNISVTNMDFASINQEWYLTNSATDLTSGQVGIVALKIDTNGDLEWQNEYFNSGESIYLEKMLHGGALDRFFIVAFRLGESQQNINVTSWNLEGDRTATYDVADNNFYTDAFLDSQSIYVLSQNQDSFQFPFRPLNWIGPFLSGQVTQLDYNLNLQDGFSFIGPNYSLFEPKQFIPLPNENLLISGRLFHEEYFFEGLQYFSLPYQPILSNPTLPVVDSDVFYCYPNPVRGATTRVFFTNNTGAAFHLELYDAQGRWIKEFTDGFDFTSGASDFSVDLKGLSSGMYFLKLVTQGQSFTTKLLID